ncbi:MAG: beta-ketoacyl synthase, partial [Clostridia bacterium]|nr:beta-ketoacyl synthase [Clostridia bacterium]
DMIDGDMELESDLGIDSIKRVEILSAVNSALGGIFTKENVEELSGISVIAEMVQYLESVAPAAPAGEIAPSAGEAPAQASVKSSVDMYALLTEAIAEKTGYPTDMIDGDMELESDLGIDSIKRVEILSAVNNALGAIFTKENVEELSGISVIAEMVKYLESLAPAEAVPAAESSEEAPAAEAPAEKTTAASAETVTAHILTSIADKTGYPEEMIENDMELEADLGIDSIKRVEIFADVLKKLNVTLTPDQTEELSAMSTVEEIASYLSKLV